MSDERHPFACGKTRRPFTTGVAKWRPIETKVVRRPYVSSIKRRPWSEAPAGPMTVVGLQWRSGELFVVLVSRAGRRLVPFRDYHSISS